MKNNYYARCSHALRAELADLIDRKQLKALYVKRPGIHFLVLLRQWLLLACGVSGTYYFRHSWVWIPFAVVTGFTIFNFTVLLHEVDVVDHLRGKLSKHTIYQIVPYPYKSTPKAASKSRSTSRTVV